MVWRVVHGARALLAALAVLAFVVAGLGILNTLATNVLEQTRQLALLRALGLRRAGVRRLVVWQALFMALVSIPPGVVAGLLLAWMMNASNRTLLGHATPLRVSPGLLLGVLLGATLLAVGAALLPARRAARLPIAGAGRVPSTCSG